MGHELVSNVEYMLYRLHSKNYFHKHAALAEAPAIHTHLRTGMSPLDLRTARYAVLSARHALPISYHANERVSCAR